MREQASVTLVDGDRIAHRGVAGFDKLPLMGNTHAIKIGDRYIKGLVTSVLLPPAPELPQVTVSVPGLLETINSDKEIFEAEAPSLPMLDQFKRSSIIDYVVDRIEAETDSVEVMEGGEVAITIDSVGMPRPPS